MAVLLVTYDLNQKGQDYSGVLEEIKKTGWARLSESSYAIKTTEKPKEVYDRISKYLDKNDQIYIINMTKPYNGYGPEKVNNWLNENLPD